MLTLGTAQLGLPKYGRTNATGCPTEAEAITLIRAAVDGGVRFIDYSRPSPIFGLTPFRD